MLITRKQALENLRTLLTDLFPTDPDGLRHLLALLPDYGNARVELPDHQGLSLSRLTRAVVEWLEAEKLVRGPLFDALVRRSPARERQIREVQRGLQRLVLFVTASPEDLGPLEVERDAAGAVKALHRLDVSPDWAVVVHHGLKLEEIIQKMLLYRPDVLHFSGHGDVWGRILVEGEEGAEQVPSKPLLALVGGASPPLQCVVWSACHSLRLAEATVKAGIPCAVGMSEAVPDETAIQVAYGFYTALAAGEGYHKALELGLVQAGLRRTPGLHIPQFSGNTHTILRSLS